MNEEQKNIETCLPENILSEVANVPTDPQFRSLTDEALDPLEQQALRQAGYDGYEKFVWTHKPYTFTSSVKQMKSNLILLLRRLWRFPFGRGTIRSLADMWQHYITRLKGNPEYGIPSRLSQLTDLPSAPALLMDRKISDGGCNIPDGISLVHIMFGGLLSKEDLYISDGNEPYDCKQKLVFPMYLFGKILRLTTKLKSYTFKYGESGRPILFGGDNLEELYAPELINTAYPDVTFTPANTYNRYNRFVLCDGANIRKIYAPKLKWTSWIIKNSDQLQELELEELEYISISGYDGPGAIHNCKNLKVINLRKLHALNGWYDFGGIWTDCPQLRKVIVGKLSQWYVRARNPERYNSNYLIHFELGNGVGISLNFGWWSPTNALDASRTDLIEEGSTAANNLEQFLQNFREYIALRLTDNGSGLTLTLSQEVRNAIHAAEDEYGIENIIITQKGWTISPAPN